MKWEEGVIQWIWSREITVGQGRRVEYRGGMTSSMNGGSSVVLAVFLEREVMEAVKD